MTKYPKQIVISVNAVLVTLGVLLSGYIVYNLRTIFGLIFVALLLALSMESMVRALMRVTVLNRPLPRGIAVLLSYLSLVFVIILFFFTTAPMIIRESQNLVNNFSFFLRHLEINGETLFESLSFLDVLGNTFQPGNLPSLLANSISTVSRLVSLIVLSAYISLDLPNLKSRFVRLFGAENSADIRELLDSIEEHIGSWVKGELTIMAAVGFLGFLGLALAGVDYALALGFISGLLEIVPIFGPLVSTVLATGVAFSQSPTKGLIAFAIFVSIQQLESNFITPKVMQKFSGFSPLVILIALMIGNEFFGVLGAVLAIPITMVLGIVYRKYYPHGAVVQIKD